MLEQEGVANNFLNDDDDNFLDERSICVFNTEDSLKDVALKVSKELQVPWISDAENIRPQTFTHVLVVFPYQVQDHLTTYAVGIQPVEQPSSKKQQQKKKKIKPMKIQASTAVSVDFVEMALEQERNGRLGSSDLLVKAVSPHKTYNYNDNDDGAIIFDLTAGLGQDAMTLLQNGASRVTMFERDPIVAALLRDGLRRVQMAAPVNGFARHVAQRLTLHQGDGSKLHLQQQQQQQQLEQQDFFYNNHPDQQQQQQPDVCYLDPMFPPRNKQSAAVKKNMQVLQGMLKSRERDISKALEDESHLLETACSIAKERVVVKRPLHEAPLGGTNDDDDDDNNDHTDDNQNKKKKKNVRQPSYHVKGSRNRWDVYVLAKQQKPTTSSRVLMP